MKPVTALALAKPATPRTARTAPRRAARISPAAANGNRGKARTGRSQTALVGGPLDSFDIELIGFVCNRSEALGCGYELYTMNVAPLDRADRARLWDALAPVVSITHGIGDTSEAPHLEQRSLELRCVCNALGLDSELADAFLMDQKCSTKLDKMLQR